MWAMLDDTDNLVNGNPVEIFRKPRAFSYVENGETYQAPANWAQLWTLQEKNDKHIFPLTYGNTVDPLIESPAGESTFSFDGSVVTETIPVQDLSIESYQFIKIEEMARYRDQEIIQDLFIDFSGTEYAFSANEVARDLMFGVMTALNSGMTFPATFKWSTIEVRDVNDVVTHPLIVQVITEVQAKTISEAMLVQYYGANKQFVELRETINNATTKAEIDAIVWV